MFNPDDYEPVAVRLDRWLKTATDPRVITHLIEYGADYCVFRAELYEADKLIATGWAEERRTDRGIMSGSMVEVCETSAIGRSLANCGMAGSDPSRRASREEMQKANRLGTPAHTSGTGSPRPASEKQINAIKTMSKKAGKLLPANLDDMTSMEASEAIAALKTALDGTGSTVEEYYRNKPSGGYTGD